MTEEIETTTADNSPEASVAVEQLTLGQELIELARIMFFAILIAVGFRMFFYDPFNIPSESMLPTLMVGDHLFVSKYSYGYSKHSFLFVTPQFLEGRVAESPVKTGDVAVFKRPFDNSTDYIKRVIGLPGDRIQMKGGTLYLNGEAVKRKRVPDFVFEETPNNQCLRRPQYRFMQSNGTAICRYPQYRETLPNGVSYMTLNLVEGGEFDNTRLYIVPEGHYFAMGDNRDNSLDSRAVKSRGVGYVPAENLVGRAELIFFSTDGSARLWEPWYWVQAARGSRFFDSLRPDEDG